MSTFKAAIALCGLSQAEAADFLQVGLDSIRSWCTGRRVPPVGMWKQLASLYRQIERAADDAADAMDLQGIDPRSFNNLEADIIGDELPMRGASAAAGAMALLMVLADEETDI